MCKAITTLICILICLISCYCKVNSDNSVSEYNKLDYVLNEVFYVNKEKPHQKHKRNISRTFIDTFDDGLTAYLDHSWPKCIEEIEQSISDFHDYYKTVASCRIKCEYDQREITPMYSENVENLHFYESIIKKTLCLEQCKRILLPNVKDFFSMDSWSKSMFRARMPYQYIQLCYYKVQTFIISTHQHYFNKKYFLDRKYYEGCVRDLYCVTHES